MNWDAIGAVAESLAAIGVIGSLIYVGFQLQQTRRASQALTAQHRVDAIQNWYFDTSQPETARILAANRDTQLKDLSPEDSEVLRKKFMALLLSSQNDYYHRQLGLLDSFWDQADSMGTFVIFNRWAYDFWQNNLRSGRMPEGYEAAMTARIGSLITGYEEMGWPRELAWIKRVDT